MTKKWIAYVVIASMMLGNTAFAQAVTELRAGQADLGATAPKPVQLERYTYSLPNHAPCVSNLDKLFLGVTRMTGKEYVEIMDGAKGDTPKREMERCIGMAFYTDPAKLAQGDAPDSFPVPDPAFMAELHDRLANGEYSEKVYRGLNCTLKNGKFEGDCNSELTGVMAYRNTVTQLPPTMVGFDLGALVLSDVEIIGGPRDGEWVKPVVTSYVVTDAPKRNDVTGRLYQVEQPCANWTSEDGQAPAPAPVATAEVPPPAIVPPVPPVVPYSFGTTNLTFYKEFWKGDKPVKELPKNADKVQFEATVGSQEYQAFVIGREHFQRTEADGKVVSGERLELSVPDVALDRTTLTAVIREIQSPDGWKPQTKDGLALAIPPNGDWLSTTRTNEAPIFINKKKECRALGLPCWAWIPIGAAVAVPFLIPHHGGSSNPGPNPIVCNPAVTKCGGPGMSPQ
jgi:hypothetical protein